MGLAGLELRAKATTEAGLLSELALPDLAAAVALELLLRMYRRIGNQQMVERDYPMQSLGPALLTQAAVVEECSLQERGLSEELEEVETGDGVARLEHKEQMD